MPVQQSIFTDWLRGKGVDPSASGLQIKACSDGMDPQARRQIIDLCMHLGQSFSMSRAPRTAVEAEQNWLSTSTDRSRVPEDLLDLFPVIWSYDRLSSRQFALTRVRYTCLANDGRTGNFFAHTLTFDPCLLERQHYNPLALSHAHLFLSEYSSQETSLPALPDLGSGTAPVADWNLLRTLCGAHLASLISALSHMHAGGRPVLICLRDWRQAAPLVETLLELIPPQVRRDVTWTTYESDRTWNPALRSGQAGGGTPPHQIMILCNGDERTWGLRPDEYASVFAIFNFVEDRFSELPPPRPYALFASQCLEDGRPEGISAYHRLLTILDLGSARQAWDTLVPAAAIQQSAVPPETLPEAARALEQSTRPEQSGAVLDLLMPHLNALTLANDFAALATLAPQMTVMIDRMPLGDPARADDRRANLMSWADQALTRGHVQTTAALLKACGRSREQFLLSLLALRAGRPPLDLLPPDPAERESWLELLLDALRLTSGKPETALSNAWLLLATCQAAKATDQSGDIWGHLKDSVKSLLGAPWSDEKETFARELAPLLPPDKCPEGSAWVNSVLLSYSKPKGKALEVLLKDLAMAGALSSQASKIIPEVVKTARQEWSDPEKLAVVLGCLDDATLGLEAAKSLDAAYREARANIAQSRTNPFRRSLADAGAAHLLCQDLSEEILPWTDSSPRQLKHWLDTVLGQYPDVLDALLQQLAVQLGDKGEHDKVMPLVEELVGQAGKLPWVAGWVPLYNAILVELPLVPLSPKWEATFVPPPKGLSLEMQARLRVMTFMRQVTQRTGQPGWSPAMFPHAAAAWQNDVCGLPPGEKKQVIRWYVDLFAGTGVTQPEQARAFVLALGQVNESSPRSVADSMEYLLAGRDVVTAVLAGTAFARCALTDSPSEPWVEFTRAIFGRFDPIRRQFFAAHLVHRFGISVEEQERLEGLLVSLGLAKPRPAAPQTAAVATVPDSKKALRLPMLFQVPWELVRKLLNSLQPVKPIARTKSKVGKKPK